MSIRILTGRPRNGKGLVCAAIAQEYMRRGRTVVADYFLEGALPLFDFSHIASPNFEGCLFILDETGSTYGARDTMALDPLVFVAATMHGHVGADVLLQAQSLMFVDIQFRRLAEEVGVVRRYGPDGHYAVKAIMEGESVKVVNGKTIDTRVMPWKRPWFFRVCWYHVTDFTIDGELKVTAKAHRTQWFVWTRQRARMYNTQQLIVPDKLAPAFEQMVEESKAARAVPPMKKGQILAPYQIQQMGVKPPTLLNKDGTPRQDQPSLSDIMEARGFYKDGQNFVDGSLSTNGLLTGPVTDGTLRKVGRLPISESGEIIEYVPQETGVSSNGNGNGKGHRNGTEWTNITPRKPRKRGESEETHTDSEPSRDDAERVQEDSCGGENST